MKLILFFLFLSLSVGASSERIYYQVQPEDTLATIGLSLHGTESALAQMAFIKKLPPPGKYLRLTPEILRLKCNIRSAPHILKINDQVMEITLVFPVRSFTNQDELKHYIRQRRECLYDLKPWRKLHFLSYAMARDDVEEKNDEVSTQNRVASLVGMEYSYRREFLWVNSWVMQLRGRILKGTPTRGFSLGPQVDLETGLGKELQRNKQFAYFKIWRSQFDFVGEDTNDFLAPYSMNNTFAGLSYEYIYAKKNKPWIGELSGYYKISENFRPEVNGTKTNLSGYALRGSLKIPFEVGHLNHFYIQPFWQYTNLSGNDYKLFVNQLALSLGMIF